MKITKLGHSCVLVEEGDRIALFDPGCWSDKDLISNIIHVDRIIYTHAHGDHFDLDILKSSNEIPYRSSCLQCRDPKIITESGIKATLREETNCTVKFSSPHEKLPLPGVEAPAENGYHFKDLFTHPGDSQHFYETKKVLVMPFIGPWGKTGDSIAKVIELKPEYVLPIHDWHYTNDAKTWLQGMLETALSKEGIKLLPNEIGKVIEL